MEVDVEPISPSQFCPAAEPGTKTAQLQSLAQEARDAGDERDAHLLDAARRRAHKQLTHAGGQKNAATLEFLSLAGNILLLPDFGWGGLQRSQKLGRTTKGMGSAHRGSHFQQAMGRRSKMPVSTTSEHA